MIFLHLNGFNINRMLEHNNTETIILKWIFNGFGMLNTLIIIIVLVDKCCVMDIYLRFRDIELCISKNVYYKKFDSMMF
jgi:hypothetical protein